MISRELLAKIKKIQIKSDRLASEILSGEYKSAFRGKGLNFDKIREYQIGDDIRLLDWKITAKMSMPFIRQYKEERQLSIVIIVDLSASNNFGTQTYNKKEMSIELASVLASLAIKNNDKVGMMLITDHIESFVPPKQGRAHIYRLIKDLLVFEPRSKKTDLKTILNEAIRLIPKNSIVFLVSDFLANKDEETFNFAKELKVLNTTQDLVAISIRDPREFSLPNIGFVEVINPETNQKQLLNLNRLAARKEFSRVQEEQFGFLTQNFKKLGIDFLELTTDQPYINKLLGLFLRREHRN